MIPSKNINNFEKTIKVCLVSSAHRALDTRIYNREARTLIKAGFHVTIIGIHPIEENIQGIRIIPLKNFIGRRKRILRNSLSILKYVLREKFDICHFHDYELIPIGVILKLFGKKVIYDVHEDYEINIMSMEWKNKLIGKVLSKIIFSIEQFASLFFDYILAADSNILSKFPAEKTELITNFPPLLLLEKKDKQESDPFKISFIGNISEEHGALKILEMVSYLSNRRNFEIHLIGDISSTNLGKKLQTNPHIFLHGRLQWIDACSILFNSDVGLFVHQPIPAYLRLTGNGVTKLFEYMDLGLPIIYSNFPNLRCLIGLIGCGLPVDPTDPYAIAQAINYLIENPHIRVEMGIKGRKAVEEKYNWENEGKKLIQVYQIVCRKL